jgi:hypothetical protein
MLYLYPLFQFGTVSLTHYNLWVDEMRRDGFVLPRQKLGTSFGFGLGFRASFVDVGIEPEILYTSSSGGDSEKNSGVTAYLYRKHTLLNFVFALPVGFSYPLTESFRLYAGARMLIGFSNLSVYDSTHVSVLNVHAWGVRDASLSASSVGMGMAFGGDLSISNSLALSVRVGYDILSFSGYEGEYEDRDSGGNRSSGVAYWVFNTKNNSLEVKDRQPKPDKDEVYAKEDLNGMRITLGLRFFIGR